MDKPSFPHRERIAGRLRELARKLDNPTPAHVALVKAELLRLAV